jgi:uncharacterized RDD family membrane protein YckC
MVSGAASANMVSSDAGPAPEIGTAIDPATDPPSSAADEARSAVWVGLYVSAARCLLTYVVAPAVGALGVFLGPVGLLLQVLGTITAIGGARRLWALHHRGRFAYALVAAALTLFTIATLGQFVLRGPS